jgi:hypothetical protein
MSIKRDDSTNWTLTYPAGDRNSQMDIEATLDGLLIDGDLLPWDEINAARKVAAQRASHQYFDSLNKAGYITGVKTDGT